LIRRRSELELFQAIGAGDDAAAFAELDDRLRRCVLWVLNRMAGGRALWGDAEEIAGEARLRLEELRGRGFSGNAPQFKSYVYKVVVSVCIDAARRRRWTESLDAPVVMPDGDERPLADIVEPLLGPGLTADASVATTEEARHVHDALERLDPRCRTLLRDFHMHEIPIRDIAARERTRENTVEVALTRCRTRLYAVFLSTYVDDDTAEFRHRVSTAARRLSGVMGRMFAAWWEDNRAVTDVSKELGLAPAEGKALLARAKREVWSLLQEGAR
jgi:RNA polymerase sigma factor (sigma-70 family)